MTPAQVLAQFLAGCCSAAFLVLVSLGVTLVFGIARVFNFAHGGMYVVGGYVTAFLTSKAEIGALPAVVAAMLAAGGVALIVYGLVFWKARPTTSGAGAIVGSYGALLLITELVRIVFGSVPLIARVPETLEGPLPVLGVSRMQACLLLIAGTCVAVTIWMINSTTLGRLIRAVSCDPWLASSCGVRRELVAVGVFVGGAGLASVAGAVSSGMSAISPSSGDDLIVGALAVALLGGRGNVLGACVVSFLLGQITAFGVVLAPRLASALPYAATVLIIAARPSGLLRAEATSGFERRT